MHWRRAHFAAVQLPVLQKPPGEQSAFVKHGPAQSASVVHEAPRFDATPRVQRLPPAWPGEVPANVRLVPLQHALKSEPS